MRTSELELISEVFPEVLKECFKPSLPWAVVHRQCSPCPKFGAKGICGRNHCPANRVISCSFRRMMIEAGGVGC
jgi:hypothetical protein